LALLEILSIDLISPKLTISEVLRGKEYSGILGFFSASYLLKSFKLTTEYCSEVIVVFDILNEACLS